MRAIEVSVLDHAGKLQVRKLVTDNGIKPSIELTDATKLEPGRSKLIFNPLFSYDPDLELRTLKYQFTFAGRARRR